jgi:hypothetical protein
MPLFGGGLSQLVEEWVVDVSQGPDSTVISVEYHIHHCFLARNIMTDTEVTCFVRIVFQWEMDSIAKHQNRPASGLTYRERTKDSNFL